MCFINLLNDVDLSGGLGRDFRFVIGAKKKNLIVVHNSKPVLRYKLTFLLIRKFRGYGCFYFISSKFQEVRLASLEGIN